MQESRISNKVLGVRRSVTSLGLKEQGKGRVNGIRKKERKSKDIGDSILVGAVTFSQGHSQPMKSIGRKTRE